MLQNNFSAIVALIQQARAAAIKAVNVELINLYWNVGFHISRQLRTQAWGSKTIEELAMFIKTNHPDIKGFNRRGLYRMKQFYDTYASATFVALPELKLQTAENHTDEIVSPLVTQLRGIRYKAKPFI